MHASPLASSRTPPPRTSPPSRWPADGGALDRLDKALSAPVHRLQLGVLAEAVLSVPGCFFGMPLMMLVSPSLIALGVGGAYGLPGWPHAALCAACASWLAAWWRVHSAPDHKLGARRAMVMYAPASVIAAPLAGTLLMAWLLGSAKPDADERLSAARAAAAGSFHLATWFASILPVITLKRLARRRRPVACEARHAGAASLAAGRAKALPCIPAMLLAGDPCASFPSGDVAGATSVAYSLWRCGGSPAAAAACVALSAFGRVYWQAHHVLDVAGGFGVTVGSCVLTELALRAATGDPLASEAMGTCPPAAVWHPLVPFAMLIGQHLLLPWLIGQPNMHEKANDLASGGGLQRD